MLQICKKYANIQTVLVKYVEKCMKYARNMLKYAGNMQVICSKYAGIANNMQEICKKYANIQTVLVKYAKNMQ